MSLHPSIASRDKSAVLVAGIVLSMLVAFGAWTGIAYAAWSDFVRIADNHVAAGLWTIDVLIDVKPGSDPSSVNPQHKGTVPVAIISSPDFDAATVDPFSVCFGSISAPESRTCDLSPSGGQPKLEDFNGDGLDDLILHFDTQSTGIEQGDTLACVTGKLAAHHGGTEIYGCGDIKTPGGSVKVVSQEPDLPADENVDDEQMGGLETLGSEAVSVDAPEPELDEGEAIPEEQVDEATVTAEGNEPGDEDEDEGDD